METKCSVVSLFSSHVFFRYYYGQFTSYSGSLVLFLSEPNKRVDQPLHMREMMTMVEYGLVWKNYKFPFLQDWKYINGFYYLARFWSLKFIPAFITLISGSYCMTSGRRKVSYIRSDPWIRLKFMIWTSQKCHIIKSDKLM